MHGLPGHTLVKKADNEGFDASKLFGANETPIPEHAVQGESIASLDDASRPLLSIADELQPTTTCKR